MLNHIFNGKRPVIGLSSLSAIGLIFIIGAAAVPASAQPSLEIGTMLVNDVTQDEIIIKPGDPFTLSVRVNNEGSQTSKKTKMELVLFRLGRSTSESTKEFNVGPIRAGKRKTKKISRQAPSAPGIYRYIACVPTNPNQSSSSSICGDINITVSESGVDVIVSSLVPTPPSVEVHKQLQIVVTPKNRGWEEVYGLATLTNLSSKVYRPGTPRPEPHGAQFNIVDLYGNGKLHALPVRFQITAPSKVGIYKYQSCLFVDGVIEENTSNNCSEIIPVTVTLPASATFDIFFEILFGDRVVIQRNRLPIQLTASFGNQGREASPAMNLYYYLSEDKIISREDTQVAGPVAIEALASGSVITKNIQIAPPPVSSVVGRRYYGACIAPPSNEVVKSNNCSKGFHVELKEHYLELPLPQ